MQKKKKKKCVASWEKDVLICNIKDCAQIRVPLHCVLLGFLVQPFSVKVLSLSSISELCFVILYISFWFVCILYLVSTLICVCGENINHFMHFVLYVVQCLLRPSEP